MRKLCGCLLVLAMMVAAGADVGPRALAQGTKKDKDTKTTKSKGGTGTVEVNEGKDGKFRFFIRDAEGKLLAMSSPSGFATAKDASKAVDDLKEIVATAKVTVGKAPAKKTDKDKDKKDK
ncbi:MAG: hypothetical protein U0840_21120 [Gemmataceae bacterium]